MLASLLNALSQCDMSMQRSTQPRVQLEELLHRVAEIGRNQTPSPS